MIFSEKTFRTFLVVGSGAAALVLWVFALSALAQNLPLKPLAEARILGWEVEEVKSDRFALRARYAYDWNGKPYTGATLFAPVYLNEISAVAGLKKEVAAPTRVLWINPAHPERSSLERVIPSGLLVRAAIATLVMFYFSFVYVRKYFRS